MIPDSSPEERRLAVRLFGLLFVMAAIGLCFVYWTRSRECARSCEARGFAESDLHLRGGGRFQMGLDCRCSEPLVVPAP